MRRVIWITVFGIVLPLAAVLATTEGWAEDEDKVDAAAIARLIEQLGADAFSTREDASRKLAARGPRARAALEKAARESDSPEVRWRAEQLLRHMRGADAEKPLGAEGVDRPKPAAPGEPGPFGSAMERLQKLLERWHKQPGSSPFTGLLSEKRVAVPGLVLERRLDGRVKLHVQRKDAAGAVVEDVYTGHSLEDILAKNPELGAHESMQALKRREAESSWPGVEDFRKQLERFGTRLAPNGPGGFSVATSSGVEIKQDASGVTVKIRERNEKGEATVKEYKGKSIEELKAKHPELKDKIGSFSIRVSPPQIFWPGFRPRGLEPLRPPLTPRSGAPGKAPFGLTLIPVSDALASHLGLAVGRGALVDNVLPGSQAEMFGVQRNDVLVKVNGQTIGLDEAADLLRKSGADKAPLSVEIIRRGKTLTLTR